MKFIYLGILLLVLAFCGMPMQLTGTGNCTAAALSKLNTSILNTPPSSNDEKELPKKKEEKEDKEDKEEKEDDRNEEENKDKYKYSTLKSVYYGFNPFEFTQKFNSHYAHYEQSRIGKTTPASPFYILYSNLKIYC